MRRIAALLLTLLAAPAWGQLSLSDFVIPAGHEVIVLAVLSASSNNELCTPNNCVSSILEGELDIDVGLTIGRDITLQIGDASVRTRRLSGSSQNIYFQDDDGTPVALYPDAVAHVQVTTPITYTIDDAGGAFSRWDLFPTTQSVSSLAGITSGTRVIFAITSPVVEPPPSTDQHVEFGTTDVETIYFGTTEGLRMYHGGTLVFGAAP